MLKDTQKRIEQKLKSILPKATYQPNQKQVSIKYLGKTIDLATLGGGIARKTTIR
jgi:hypothetical protein